MIRARSGLKGAIHPLQRQAHGGLKGTREAQGHPSGLAAEQNQERDFHVGNFRNKHHKITKMNSIHCSLAHVAVSGSARTASLPEPPHMVAAYYPHMATQTKNN